MLLYKKSSFAVIENFAFKKAKRPINKTLHLRKKFIESVGYVKKSLFGFYDLSLTHNT